MADRLELPDPDLHALATGTVIVAFAPRYAVDLNDELELVPIGARPASDLSAAHLANVAPPTGAFTGLVVGLQPAASLASDEGAAHHILAAVPAGDVVIMRVFSIEGPVLTDPEFAERLAAIEAVFR
ncbi:MAG: hypothetical protein HKN80_12840 [Acidimicrobiia bacterium]|nr:hypothetical protein [Acidimicrobiia bacterium]